MTAEAVEVDDPTDKPKATPEPAPEPIQITQPGVYNLDAQIARVMVGKRHAALVDARDLRLVASVRWHLLRGHNGKLYAHANAPGGPLYMHRLILGTPVGQETDHINGDGLDNRRVNLRAATASQNRANMWKPARPDGRPHSSRYKGVSWDKSRGRWQAKIEYDQRSRNLGRFETEIEAALAYDQAATATWGPFARLNLPPEGQS